MVIAETRAQAEDAADLVRVDYEPLPSVTSTAAAAEAGSAAVWDECPDNISNLFEAGDKAATDAAFAKAARIVRRRYVITRVHAQYMEARGALGVYDRGEDRYTLYADVQYPHRVRTALATNILKIAEHRIRVIAGDIGGAFGTKGWQYAEHRLVLWAARKLGRPVKWMCERREAIPADEHARDNVTDAELALDADGRFIGLRVRTLANVGAYVSSDRNLLATFSNVTTLVGVYTFPAAYVQVLSVMTNTNSTAPYRGAERQGHAPDGIEEPGPGARDAVQADPARAPRARPGRRALHRRRHRARRLRHGHHGLALDRHRRHRAVDRGGQGHRQGQEDRRAPAGGVGGRHHVRGWEVLGRGHRSRGRPQGRRARGVSARPAPARPRARALRDRHVRAEAGHVAERLPRLRGRDRSGHGRGHARLLRHRRRRRHGDQPGHAQGTDPRRRGARRRAGADGAGRLRRGVRPAPHGVVHGLRDPARRYAARHAHREQPGPDEAEPARRQGGRRSGHGRRATGGDERGDGRARGRGRARARHAGERRARVERDPRRRHTLISTSS